MSDLSTKVLIEIRDEIRATNSRLDATNARLDATGARLDARLDAVEKRQAQTEVRVMTELVAVRGAVEQVVDLLRADRTLRHDVDDLKERVATLEHKTG